MTATIVPSKSLLKQPGMLADKLFFLLFEVARATICSWKGGWDEGGL